MSSDKAEKISDEVQYTTHNEKNAVQDGPPSYNVAEESGRRASVALNIVENPLKRKGYEQTIMDGRQFAEARGMSEYADLFGRAALVAREPDRFETIQELETAERDALVYERDHKWHGPKMLWYSIALCAIGAATQGWDQTGSNGANLSFPQEFGLDNGTNYDEWIVGLINAIIFLTAGLIGAFIVDPLNKYFGRRGEIFITACCLTATPIGSGFAKSWQGLFAARFVMGIGIGAKNATVPIYSAEMAPARIRGALVMFWQLWVVAGIFLGFCANVIVKDTGRISWRLQLGSAFIPSFILGVGIFFCPESPRWLMKNNKHAKGFRSMQILRAHDIIAARDYYYSWVIYEEELKVAAGAGYFQRLWDCFAVPRIRRANYGASTVMIAQQMCGINSEYRHSRSKVSSTTKARTAIYTVTSSSTYHPTTTVTQSQPTVTSSVFSTSTITTTLPFSTSEIDTTTTIFATSTSLVTVTATSTATSTTTFTSTPTSTIPTSSGFMPLSSVLASEGFGVSPSPMKRGIEERGKGCTISAGPSGSLVHPSLYPTLVECVEYVQVIKTSIKTSTGSTVTKTAPLVTATKTTTSTVTTTTTVTPSIVSVTSTVSTTSTQTLVSTVPTTTTITSTTSTTSIAPVKTVNAICQSNNYVTYINSTYVIGAFQPNNYNIGVDYNVNSLDDCCNRCAAMGSGCAVGAFAPAQQQCLYVPQADNTCSISMEAGSFRYGTSQYPGFTLFNTDCGVFDTPGTYNGS